MLPVQITFRDFPSSPAIETNIRKRAEKLHRFNGRIISCRVMIDVPQKHKHRGKLFNVKIDVTVPGREFVATHKADEDVYIAIRDAFHAIIRQLEADSRKRKGHVKTHHDVMHGHIVRMIPMEGYGFIEGMDGNEYYFSLTNVSYPGFKQLSVGDAVEYTAETFSDGRHAQHIVKERQSNNHAYAAY
jgi:ribosomal subunit interface protein